MKRLISHAILKRYLAMLIFTLLYAELKAYNNGGYIQAINVDCQSNTYNFILRLITDAGSTVLYGGADLNFGDGSYEINIDTNKPDSIYYINAWYKVSLYQVAHTFPGPGQYTVFLKAYNRVGGIVNCTNSVNSPFYIETQIIIDPFFGCNNSPELKLFFPYNTPLNKDFSFSPIGFDMDGDSLSYELMPPQINRDKTLFDYQYPFTMHSNGYDTVSRAAFHKHSQQLVWLQSEGRGNYAMAMRIKEWRYFPELDSYKYLGFTTLDISPSFSEVDYTSPNIEGFSDTVLNIANQHKISFTVSEINSDSIWASLETDLTLTSDATYLYHTPNNLEITIETDGIEKNTLCKPYRIIINTSSVREYSVESQQPYYVWLTDKQGNPPPPTNLTKEFAFQNKISINWADNSLNEAGFIVERSDTFFPEFFRIAALPANATRFTDDTIIPNRTYSYRVKAMGSEGSSYSEPLTIERDEIVTGSQKEFIDGIEIYPNPVSDKVFLRWSTESNTASFIKISNISGQIMFSDKTREATQGTIEISTAEWQPGMYIIEIFSEGKQVRNLKIIKR